MNTCTYVTDTTVYMHRNAQYMHCIQASNCKICGIPELIYHVNGHRVANWLSLIFDLLICRWITLSRKDDVLKDPPP